MTMRLFCVLGIGICALLWYPAFHYQGVLRVLGISFLGMAVIATFIERSDPPVHAKK
ncbi:hypothetical protein GOB86_01770 [Acetobacter lambici]|uniref:Uncharacterized protein n=1 Tax=Acetobacter lambici TaxID=1332824 RepID=A0ABT1EX37_9PROT|nr:hypothetical protein [Acetobacter lambici]MCP1241002.1 hypothetical protein [Acetobacter lambici]MCP1257326.1 hypothetical protein [Acetobacter lambici]NHO55816.1 hypothetical protein [Acetobacter lambici]